MAIDFYSPPFVTETDQPSPYLDCQWAAGLMLANKASLGAYPSTKKERQALRYASGDHLSGSSFVDLRKGILKRYGWMLNIDRIQFDLLLRRLKRGDGCVANGLYSRLPDHFQRWDVPFSNTGSDSEHAAYVQGHDRGDNQHIGPNGILKDVFWNDPLGRGKTYRGEWMPVDVFHAFLLGLRDGNLLLAATVRQGQANG